MIPIPPVSGAELDKWYQDCMTTDAVSVFPVPPSDPMPEELMDAYFTNPAPHRLRLQPRCRSRRLRRAVTSHEQ